LDLRHFSSLRRAGVAGLSVTVKPASAPFLAMDRCGPGFLIGKFRVLMKNRETALLVACHNFRCDTPPPDRARSNILARDSVAVQNQGVVAAKAKDVS